METVSLEVSTRDKVMKAKDLLKDGLLPIEYYGNGVENKSLQVDYQNFRRAFRTAGSNTVMELNIDGKEKVNVLVHEIQYNPYTDGFRHIGMINVRMDQEVHTQVPLEFVGTSLAVKDLGGTLMTHLSELDVKCLPKDLVHNIEVSIDSLEDFNSSIHVSDLTIPNGIEVLNDAEDVVATVAPPVEEEEPEVAEGEEGAEGGAVEEGATAEEKGEEAAGEEQGE